MQDEGQKSEVDSVIDGYLRGNPESDHPIEDGLRRELRTCRRATREVSKLLKCEDDNIIPTIQHLQRQRDEFYSRVQELEA